MGLNESFMAELQYEAQTTRRLLERVPAAALAWKPHEKFHDFRSTRITRCGDSTLDPAIIETAEFDIGAANSTGMNSSDVQEILDAFDANVIKATESLKSVTDQQLMEKWRLRRGDHVLFELPKIAVLRSMAFSHQVHHRGQLSVYLRLQDVALPSIYGPTADEPF